VRHIGSGEIIILLPRCNIPGLKDRLEIAKHILETAGLLPISVYNNEWIPIATYFETHLPNTERSDEIDSTDGGSDTDTQSEELTTHIDRLT
jgi:hypothetical protein